MVYNVDAVKVIGSREILLAGISACISNRKEAKDKQSIRKMNLS